MRGSSIASASGARRAVSGDAEIGRRRLEASRERAADPHASSNLALTLLPLTRAGLVGPVCHARASSAAGSSDRPSFPLAPSGL